MGDGTKTARSRRACVATFAGGGSLVLLALVLQNVGNFAFHAAAARIVGSHAYGALGTLLTLTVALTLPLAALQTAVARSVAEVTEQTDPRRFLRRAAFGAVCLTAVIAIGAPMVSSFLALGSVGAAMLLGPYVGMAVLAAVTRGVAVGRARFSVAAASIVAAVVARVAIGIPLTAWIGIDGAMIATFIGEAVGVTVALRAARTAEGAERLRVAWAAIADTLVVTVGVWLLGSADVLIAGHFLVDRQRALYVAAGTAARAILVLPQAVVMVAMPRFVRALRDDDAEVAPWPALRDALALGTLLTVAAVAAVALGGSQLLSITFGRAFGAGGSVLALCAIATIPVALASILATFHLARHSRLALLPWIGVGAELVTTAIWHDSAEQLALAALAGVSAQLVVTLGAVGWERSHRRAMVRPAPRTAVDPSDRLRILVLAWRDLAHPAAGGSEVYVEAIARRWAATGNAVTLCCAAVRDRPAREMVHGVEIVRAGSRFSVYRRARRFVAAERRFDVILECVNTKPFDARRVAKAVPVVGLIHQTAREVWWYEVPLPAAALGRFILEPRWLRRFQGVPTLTISASSRDSLVAHGIRDVTVVPVGVDPPDPAVPTEKATVPTLVYCGRLVRSKRPDHALAAFRRLRTQIPDLRLVMVGTGPMARRLRRRAPDGLELVGRLSPAAKQRAIASAHALVVTSVREGWGLVVSEAAAVGTPTAGYDVAGLRDSIAAAHGVTCAADPKALARALALALPGWVANPPAPLPSGGAASWDDTAAAVLEPLIGAAASAGVGARAAPATAPAVLQHVPTLEGART